MSEIKRPVSEQIEELSDQIAEIGLSLTRLEKTVNKIIPAPVWHIPESQAQDDYLAEKNPSERVSAFRQAALRLYGGGNRG